MSATAAAQLAAFYAALGAEDLPAATVQAARRHMLDTFGAALAGAAQPEPVAARAAGRVLWGTGGTAPLWGCAERVAPGLAALVNGTAAHALELDDASGCDHSGAVVVPAVLAGLDAAPEATESDAIAAVVVGYDAGRRVLEAVGGYDAHNGAGWHSTGTCGVFAAAAAVARLWRLPPATFCHTLGIAGSFASGTWAFLAEGAMTKRLHPGHAAAGGLLAASLARAGMTGPAAIFEAPWGGFLPTYAGAAAVPEALTEGLGARWRIHRSSIKPYASCRGTHAAVEAALQLRARVPADAVDTVEAGVHPTIVRMCGGKTVETLVDAQMSLPYAVAVAWLYGDATLPRFAPAVRADGRLRDWLERIRVVHDPAVPSNIAVRLSVIRQGSAQAETVRVDVPLGSWDRPLADAAVKDKFDGLATPVIGAEQADALARRVLALGGDRPAADLALLLASRAAQQERRTIA